MSDYFIYTGNSYPHKNLSRLIDAMVLLNAKREEKVILKIVSARSVFIERLEKSIKAKGAQRYVELLGFVPDKELERLYKSSLAFVYPTLSEGFGLPPMEAINAGTLIVASDIPVLKEVYKNSISYFDPYDVTSIETALEEVLKVSEAERVRTIEYSVDFVKRYSWAKMAKETLKIYEQEGCNSLRSGK